MKTYEQVLDEVIGAIEQYEGEEIVANEHPLHLAIQALEARQRPMPLQQGMQNKLFMPSSRLWFGGLFASRGQMPEYFEGEPSEPQGVGPRAAIAWMLLLRDQLIRQVADADHRNSLRERWSERAKHRIKAMAGKLPPLDDKYKRGADEN